MAINAERSLELTHPSRRGKRELSESDRTAESGRFEVSTTILRLREKKLKLEAAENDKQQQNKRIESSSGFLLSFSLSFSAQKAF